MNSANDNCSSYSNKNHNMSNTSCQLTDRCLMFVKTNSTAVCCTTSLCLFLFCFYYVIEKSQPTEINKIPRWLILISLSRISPGVHSKITPGVFSEIPPEVSQNILSGIAPVSLSEIFSERSRELHQGCVQKILQKFLQGSFRGCSRSSFKDFFWNIYQDFLVGFFIDFLQ